MRAVFFFPTVLSMVIVGLTWQQLLQLSGPINSALSAIAGHPVLTAWLADTHLVLWVLIWVSNWQWSGWTMVLYLAGMSGIPQELLEAARLDGAGTGQLVRQVVFPLLRHVTALALLLNVVGGFQVFDTIYVMTAGGPNHASEVLSTYAYWNAFAAYGPGELGYAAAITVVMLMILFVFAVARVRMSELV
jgi:ABC-type sugar transport system permease subunit